MKEQKAPELIRTEFSCNAPNAKTVFLAGTFNDWNPTALPMSKRDDGVWIAVLDLAAGFYHYKFVIDGEWTCDPTGRCAPGESQVDQCVPNAYGTMDRVKVVG